MNINLPSGSVLGARQQGAATGAASGAIGGAIPFGFLGSPLGGAVTAAVFNVVNQVATNECVVDWRQVGVQAFFGGVGSLAGGVAGKAVGNQLLAQRLPPGGTVPVVNLAQSVNAITSGMAGIGANALTPVSLGGYIP